MIYFFQGEITRRIKIGTTKRFINQRMSEAQANSPDKLFFIGYMPGDKDIESHLRNKFLNSHSHGEWHNESPEILSYIQNNCIHEINIAHKVESLVNSGKISYQAILKLAHEEITDIYMANIIDKLR